MTTRLRELIGRARVVLFDFDGPTCDVFSTVPAPHVAAALLALIDRIGLNIPKSVADERDPLAVLKFSAMLGEEVVKAVDDALRMAELRAVQNSTPTPGADVCIRKFSESGRRVGFVSNNSVEAIERYLNAHDLNGYVSVVIGREYGNPALMKPNPLPIGKALLALVAQPADALLIGDSRTDVEASRAARLPCIGYVNKPGKDVALAGADALVTNMAEIAAAI